MAPNDATAFGEHEQRWLDGPAGSKRSASNACANTVSYVAET